MAALKIALSHLVLCALLGVIGVNGKPPSAVLSGEPAADSEFPYQVSLNIFGQHTCGGSIIDSRHIVTAAHCIDNVNYAISSMTVTAGTTYLNLGIGDNYRIKNVNIHPGFLNSEYASWRNDIAVITLSSAIKFDRRHRPVRLPTSDTPANTRVTACGWGDTAYPNGVTPTGLQKLSMVVLSNSRCAMAGIAGIHDTHICAYSSKGAGVCTGDSGGPLLDGDTLIGIASFVIPCGKGFPDVFTRVHSYVDWINQVRQMG